MLNTAMFVQLHRIMKRDGTVTIVTDNSRYAHFLAEQVAAMRISKPKSADTQSEDQNFAFHSIPATDSRYMQRHIVVAGISNLINDILRAIIAVDLVLLLLISVSIFYNANYCVCCLYLCLRFLLFLYVVVRVAAAAAYIIYVFDVFAHLTFVLHSLLLACYC